MITLSLRCDGSYQSEGAQHTEPLDVRQAELHEAEADDDAVEDVPARLEVVVRVQSDDLQHHLCCEDPREHLRDRDTLGEEFKHVSIHYSTQFILRPQSRALLLTTLT